ncbi:MAG: hypothetical protein IKK26_06895 [Clostridia bacterium]|nr:hypothetical protein [Clostridia bacterium]
MKWTVKTQSSTCGVISLPVFEAENKREKKSALRMNNFYGDIISAIEKNFTENDYKYYIDITSENDNDNINVRFSFIARQRGRTIKNVSHNATWKNGVIVK